MTPTRCTAALASRARTRCSGRRAVWCTVLRALHRQKGGAGRRRRPRQPVRRTVECLCASCSCWRLCAATHAPFTGVVVVALNYCSMVHEMVKRSCASCLPAHCIVRYPLRSFSCGVAPHACAVEMVLAEVQTRSACERERRSTGAANNAPHHHGACVLLEHVVLDDPSASVTGARKGQAQPGLT